MEEDFMKAALKEARKAYLEDEVPVGAVIVKDGKIIAIQKASKKLNTWRLTGCTMYVTLEPCVMCAGAMIQSRLDKVVFGTVDEKTGACGTVLNVLQDYKFNHIVEIEKGIMEKECKGILQDFFKELREKKKQQSTNC